MTFVSPVPKVRPWGMLALGRISASAAWRKNHLGQSTQVRYQMQLRVGCRDCHPSYSASEIDAIFADCNASLSLMEPARGSPRPTTLAEMMPLLDAFAVTCIGRAIGRFLLCASWKSASNCCIYSRSSRTSAEKATSPKLRPIFQFSGSFVFSDSTL